MKQIISKKLLPLLLLPALLLSFSILPERANFSGEWKLNEDKSEFGEFGSRFTPKTVKIKQVADTITISKTSSFNGTENTTTESLTFDGKESESTVFGNSKKKSTAKWSDDGQTLNVNYTIAFERNGATMELKGTETWSLTKEGMFSLVTVSSSPRGEMTTKAVYGK